MWLKAVNSILFPMLLTASDHGLHFDVASFQPREWRDPQHNCPCPGAGHGSEDWCREEGPADESGGGGGFSLCCTSIEIVCDELWTSSLKTHQRNHLFYKSNSHQSQLCGAHLRNLKRKFYFFEIWQKCTKFFHGWIIFKIGYKILDTPPSISQWWNIAIVVSKIHRV